MSELGLLAKLTCSLKWCLGKDIIGLLSALAIVVVHEPNMLPLAPAPVSIAVPGSPATTRSRSRAPTVVEPSEEPTVPSRTATPHAAPSPTPPAPVPRPVLDPATAALYETVDAETFRQRRDRFNKQEKLSFGPLRRQRTGSPPPYDTTTPASASTPPVEQGTTEQHKAEQDTPATAAAAEAPAQVSAAPVILCPSFCTDLYSFVSIQDRHSGGRLGTV